MGVWLYVQLGKEAIVSRGTDSYRESYSGDIWRLCFALDSWFTRGPSSRQLDRLDWTGFVLGSQINAQVLLRLICFKALPR